MSQVALADMMYIPTRSIGVEQIISYHSNFQTTIGSNLQFMLKLGNDLDILDSFLLEGEKEDSLSKILKNFNKQKLLTNFEQKLFQKRLWTKKLGNAHLTLIKNNNKKIESLFGTDTYSGAWFHLQLGHVDTSKKTLKALFETQYKQTHALENVINGFGDSPLTDISKTFNTLKWLSTKKEKKELENRFRKLKIHISNLPQSHIFT